MKALITVTGLQKTDGEVNKTEIITEGEYEKTDYGWLIKYDETDATGYEGAHTQLQLHNDGKLQLIRTGSVLSDLLVEPNEKNYCQYGTPYGMMTVGIYGKRTANNLTEKGGEVNLEYTLNSGGLLISENKLTMNIKEL
mgnify:CR=1 FL=1